MFRSIALIIARDKSRSPVTRADRPRQEPSLICWRSSKYPKWVPYYLPVKNLHLSEGCHWLDYKAVRLHDSFYAGYFQENEVLIDYVNRQPLNSLLACLGDGHDGIWNLIGKFNPDGNRREILDWFHLLENLHKVGGSNKRLAQAKKLLWQGRIDETIKLFELCRRRQAENFCNYLKTILRTVLE
ncbi:MULTISPECIES: hypothetical protein [unclassified Microcoleus]|uniref:hypothetical protein n=1 Tax=unclassified Microcoleus TaxID=2642155 RepID=UPI00404089C5